MKHILQLSSPAGRNEAASRVLLTAAQAQSAQRLGATVADAQMFARQQHDRHSSIAYLEKKHRAHVEQLSEFM